MTEDERRATERVKRAKVKAPDAAILAWVRSIGAELIMGATLREIREVAAAF